MLAKVILSNAKQRAKRKGLKFDLDLEWIIRKLQLNHCEVTGIEFVFSKGKVKRFVDNPFSPSIDRIDPAGDYTPANCQITCWIYNRSKGAFAMSDFDKFANALYVKITDANLH